MEKDKTIGAILLALVVAIWAGLADLIPLVSAKLLALVHSFATILAAKTAAASAFLHREASDPAHKLILGIVTLLAFGALVVGLILTWRTWSAVLQATLVIALAVLAAVFFLHKEAKHGTP